MLVMKEQTPLRFAMCHKIEGVSKGMARPNPQEWLQMGTLGDWSDHDAMNNGQTLVGKKKTPCSWFSNGPL
jgi:hypothetical protein